MPLEEAGLAARLVEIPQPAQRRLQRSRSSKKTGCSRVPPRWAGNLKSAARNGKNNFRWLAKFAASVECAPLRWLKILQRANPLPTKQKSSHNIVMRMA